MRLFFSCILVLILWNGRAQSIISSNTYIQACIDKTQCSAINNSSYLFYDENSANLYLKIDFAAFKTGQDSIDDWLNDLTGSNLYFKAPVSPEAFKGLSNHKHRTLKLNGQLQVNGIWQGKSIELTLFSSENGIMTTNTNDNLYDHVKVNFSFSFLPKDFKLHKKPHHLRKSIFLGVALGRINLLQPAQRALLGEAYNH